MADTPIGTGTVLAGRYRLDDLLEEAAGAKFWRATDQTLARSVAVHVVASQDPRAPTLLDAARTSAIVTDAHFLRVLDAARMNGVVYVVNEWGSGISLDRMLASEPIAPRRAAWLVKEVADAVANAHHQGVAHGRLLPESVMVTEAGSVKLIGFVVDAVLHSAQGSAGGVPGGDVAADQRRDVQNLAALLYATLVARWPGSAGSDLPDAPRVHGRPLRPRQVRAGIPRTLDAICDRVLNPDGHPHAASIETAHEIFAALSDYIGDPTGSAQRDHQPTSVLKRVGDPAGDLAGESSGESEADQPSPTERTSDQAPVLAGPTDAGPTDSKPDDAWPDDAGRSDADAEQTRAGIRPVVRADPEATQAGAPVFFAEHSGVGWTSPEQGRRVPGDHPDDHRREAPPPPPELEPRPLFAPDPPGGRTRRVEPVPETAEREQISSAASRPISRTGPGTGSLPAMWGPDADRAEPEDEGSSWNGSGGGRSWLKLGVILALFLALVVAVVLVVNLSGGRGTPGPGAGLQEPGTPSTTSPHQEVAITAVSDFDPEGNGEENADLAPLAIDGKPDTAWQSVTYYDNPKLGLLKDGVGLVVDLGSSVKVSSVRLDLVGSPTSLQLLAADDGAAAPTGLDGLRKVASAVGAGTSVDLEPKKPVTTQYLVVWLTSLPAVSGGYQGQIAEIAARS